MIRTKRIYESSKREDGCRVLVDRIWPRGISRERAKIDHWLKELAPSTQLRQWFGHDPKKWIGFVRRYEDELRQKPSELETLREIIHQHRVVTLVYAARDERHNNAAALRQLMSAIGSREGRAV